MRTAVGLLWLVTLAAARPGRLHFGGGFPHQQFHHLPAGTATGGASGTVITGTSQNGPFQGATITQLGASAGGTASGNAASTNSASATNLNSNGPFGQNQFSNTNANSNQQTFGGTGHFSQGPFGFGK